MDGRGYRAGRRPAVGRLLLTGTLLTGMLLTGMLLPGCGSDRGDRRGGEGGPAASSVVAPPSPTTATGPAPTVGSRDWPVYHRTADRAGQVIGVGAPRVLRPGWTVRLDGAVYGQPLVLGDLVVAATEGDSVYGLGLADGRVRWRTNLGAPVPLSDLPCGNVDPLGITGTPAYDPGTGSVFVVAQTSGGRHELAALDVRNGSVRFRRDLDLTGRDRLAEQQRGALAVAGGRVYVPFGGLYGDCGNYVGYVTATPVRGNGPTLRYEIPTSREGGIWAASGVAVDAAGDVWVAVGNGQSTGEPYDGSDSVLRLSADLSRRLDYFAPSDWGSQNAADADLGTTGPVLLAPDRVLISGKSGEVDLLQARRLGGIGGASASIGGCRGFGGIAWDAAAAAAFVPCEDGVLRVDVGPASLSPGWKAPGNVAGTPVAGGGAVWVLDPDAGRLHVLDERSGAELASAPTGRTSRFASVVPVPGRVVVPTLTGVATLDLG